MHEKTQRIFVGSIPPGVSEADLRQEFAAYGKVQNVDLKTKENLVDPGNPNMFAFISLEISDQMMKTCIAEFSSTQYRGRYLMVSVARENFLDRLKREREEAAKAQGSKPLAARVEEATPKVKDAVQKANGVKIIASTPKNEAVKSKVASSSSESESESSEDSSSEEETAAAKRNTRPAAMLKDSDDEADATTFISKKNASSSLQNGKIKIQSVSADPIHIISKKGKESKHLEGSAHQSDQKRKESLNKMKNQYNQQKLAIQQALSSVDTSKRKILFESNDVEEETTNSNHQQDKRKLFDGDDNEEDDEEMEDYSKDFQVKTQFQGKDGEKLMKLQSKFKLDPRFAMNSRFLNDEEGYEQDQQEERPVEENEERNWQMGIIEQVVGRSLESVPDPNRKKIKNQMTRFDPSKDDHKRFYRTDEGDDDPKSNKKSATATTDSNDVEVSKDQFYNVSEDLTKSLRRRGDGFSLLSMFGRAEDNQHDNDKKSAVYNEKPLINSKSVAALINPFKFDSSDSENEDDRDVTMKSDINNDDSKTAEKKTTTKLSTAGGKINKTGIWTENFFIFNIDPRFDEGAAFFKAHRRENAGDELEQDYDEIRGNLRTIIQRKMVKKRKMVDGFKTRASKFKKRK